MKWRLAEYSIGIAISVIALAVYVTTLCPTVSFIDSGELATVAYTLGIAHPTGYPLFTLLGWFFSHLPLGLRTIYQLNLMAAVLCSAGLFFFFRFLVFVLGDILQRDHKKPLFTKDIVTEVSSAYVFVPAAVGTLLLGFSETYWSQAVAIEVYSLHALFLASLLLLFTGAVYTSIPENKKNEQAVQRSKDSSWYLFAFVLGLAFTNHMTTILLAPAFLVLYFYMFKFNRDSWMRIVRMVLPFLAGFSLYFYLPVRASESPLLNWGNPVDLERFLTHFSGKVYRVWLFSSTESAGKQLRYFMDTLPSEFSYFPYIFTLFGIWKLLRTNRTMLVFTLLLFVGCVLYSINYDIHDIDSYFLLAYVTIAIWSAIGVREILSSLIFSGGRRAFSALLIVSAFVLVAANHAKVDESKNVIVEDYTKDMLNSVKPNGIIISYQWDYFVSASYYFRYAEQLRPDVVVIDKELLRRSWYYKQLEHTYPWLIEGSKKEMEAFLVELYKFEHDLPYNNNLIEYRYASFIKSIIEKNIVTRPVYVTEEIEAQYTPGYIRVPAGLAYRLATNSSPDPYEDANFNFSIPVKSNKYIDQIVSLYSRSYYNHALYNYTGKDKTRAAQYIQKALDLQPDMREGLILKDKIMAIQ